MVNKQKKRIHAKKSSISRRGFIKSFVAAGVAAQLASAADAGNAELSSDVQQWKAYALKLSLSIPQIYSNEKSLGSRKYQRQTIMGTMHLGFNRYGQLCDVEFSDFVNKTHRLSNGKNVTYDAALASNGFGPCFNAIGSNRTNVFKTASICFSLAAEPSYNIGQVDEETSLYITLGGKGTIVDGNIRRANGYASGTLGCGCAAYGHVSPTRTIGADGPTDEVSDIGAVFGTWTLKAK